MLKHAEGGNFTRQRTCESKSKTPFIQVIFVVKFRSKEETSPFRSGQRTEARERDSGGGGGVEARKRPSVTCDGIGDSRCRTPGVPRTPGLPGSNDRVGYRPRRCSAITSSSIPELHRRASGTKRVHEESTSFAVHSVRNALATLAPLFCRGFPYRSIANTASVGYCMYFGRSRSPVLRRSLSHHPSQVSVQGRHIHALLTLHLICESKSIVQPARCTTFVFFGLAFPAKNRLSKVVPNFVHALLVMPMYVHPSLSPSLEMANFHASWLLPPPACRVCWCTFSRC